MADRERRADKHPSDEGRFRSKHGCDVSESDEKRHSKHRPAYKKHRPAYKKHRGDSSDSDEKRHSKKNRPQVKKHRGDDSKSGEKRTERGKRSVHGGENDPSFATGGGATK